ncbi:hypothetical protein ILYODFUR_037090, partial [Ilyodon furcidens]
STKMDEDTQLQVAESFSQKEQEQEQRCRQGDDSLLQKALDESRRESQSGTHEGAVGCRYVAPGEHSGAKGLAQGPRVATCGIRTQPLVFPPELKAPALTTRPPLPQWWPN